ncbi:MAG: hypothetical protein GC161_14645 [Planctomycetaceae bacterium]|nr:hypothetical protein [Planctomycetaceae bacterium]
MKTLVVLAVLSVGGAPVLWGSARAVAQGPCETFRIENPHAPLDGHFGHAVDVDGDRMVVGMHSHQLEPKTGTAYVYERGLGGWVQSAELAISDGVSGCYYGWSVALDGDVALVGRQADGTLNAKGSVYVFQRQPNGAWVQTQKIVQHDAEAWAFGWALDLDGTRAAIPAKGAGSLGPKARVYIYELEDGQFVEKAKLKPSLDNLSDWFGASLDLDGDRVAIGAPKGGTGRAYIFDRQPDGMWTEQALLLPGDLASADQFGYAVALDQDRVAISAPFHDQPWINHGAIYIFERGNDAWPQTAKISVLGNTPTPRLGFAMGLVDDDLFAGSPGDATFASSAGATYHFRHQTGGWQTVEKFFGSELDEGSAFGWSLARSGATLVVGAPGSTTPTPGRVHEFSTSGGAQLSSSSGSVSNAGGGAQVLTLGACAQHGGDFYLLLGSYTGTAPAFPLGDSSLPLVADVYTLFTLQQPNAPTLPGSLGVLDPWGRATAAFLLPPGAPASTIGLTLHHAYVVFDAQTLAIELASNSVPVTIGP